jgi:hypothetical protein
MKILRTLIHLKFVGIIHSKVVRLQNYLNMFNVDNSLYYFIAVKISIDYKQVIKLAANMPIKL